MMRRLQSFHVSHEWFSYLFPKARPQRGAMCRCFPRTSGTSLRAARSIFSAPPAQSCRRCLQLPSLRSLCAQNAPLHNEGHSPFVRMSYHLAEIIRRLGSVGVGGSPRALSRARLRANRHLHSRLIFSDRRYQFAAGSVPSASLPGLDRSRTQRNPTSAMALRRVADWWGSAAVPLAHEVPRMT